MTTLHQKILRFVALLGALTFGTVGQAQAEQLAQATGPTEIPRGSILVLDVGGPQRWIIMPSSGPDFHVYVATLSGEQVDVAVHRLPIGGDPDDPDDPPPDKTLADSVDEWADAVGDPATRVKLAAAYGAMLTIFDSIPSVEALVFAQTALNKRVIAAADVEKWEPFGKNLKAYLETHTPAGMAGHRVAWQQIANGLASGTDNTVRGAIQAVYAEDVAAELRSGE